MLHDRNDWVSYYQRRRLTPERLAEYQAIYEPYYATVQRHCPPPARVLEIGCGGAVWRRACRCGATKSPRRTPIKRCCRSAARMACGSAGRCSSSKWTPSGCARVFHRNPSRRVPITGSSSTSRNGRSTTCCSSNCRSRATRFSASPSARPPTSTAFAATGLPQPLDLRGLARRHPAAVSRRGVVRRAAQVRRPGLRPGGRTGTGPSASSRRRATRDRPRRPDDRRTPPRPGCLTMREQGRLATRDPRRTPEGCRWNGVAAEAASMP